MDLPQESYLSHNIHLWYSMVYLPTFTININQHVCKYTSPMDALGMSNTCDIRCLQDEQFASERVRLAQLTNKLGSSRGKLQSPCDHLGCLPVYSHSYSVGSLSWLVCWVGFDQNLQIFSRWLQRFFWFSPRTWLGEMIQFEDHIFQGGWFNHQLEMNMKGLLKPMMLFLRPYLFM